MELLQRIKSIFRKRHPIEQEPCIQKQDTSTQINKPLNRKRKADTASDTPSEEVLQIHPARKRPRSNPQSQRSALDSSGIRESKTKSTDHDNRRPNANESKRIGQLLENASCSTTIIPQQPLSLSSSLGREGGAVDGLGLIREPAAKKDSYVEKRADRTAYQKWMSSQRVSQKCNVLAKRRAVDGGRVELPKVMLGMHQDRIREKDEKLVEKAPYISKTVSPCVADCDSTKDDRSEALVLADDGVSPSASLASTRGVLPNTKKRKINQDSLASAAKRFRSSLTAAPVEECHLQNHEIEPNSGREEVETDLCPSRPNTNESSPDTKPIAAETLAGILEHLVAKSEEMKKFSEQLEQLKSMYKKQAERTGSILTVAPQVSVQPLQQLKESQLVAYLQGFVQHFYQIGSDNAHRQSQTQKEDGLNSSLGSDSRKLGRSNMSISLLNPAHVAPQVHPHVFLSTHSLYPGWLF